MRVESTKISRSFQVQAERANASRAPDAKSEVSPSPAIAARGYDTLVIRVWCPPSRDCIATALGKAWPRRLFSRQFSRTHFVPCFSPTV